MINFDRNFTVCRQFKSVVFSFVLLIGLIGANTFAAPVEGTKPLTQKSWQFVKSAIAQRNSAVKQCFLQGFRSQYDDSQTRREHYKNWQSFSGSDAAPAPLDSNEVKAFSWFTDVDRWRLDILRVYPSVGQDFKQTSFDGEKFISFDEYYKAGRVTATRNKSIELNTFGESDFTSFSRDAIFGGGVVSALEQYLPKNGIPAYEKNETINGLDCQKYNLRFQKEDTNWSIQIWFAVKQRCVAKLKQEIAPIKAGVGTLNYLVVSDFKIQSGVYIPFLVKTELYIVDDNKTQWGSTKVFQVDQVQINDRNSVSAFKHPIRIGSPVTNQLDNPGPFKLLGGDTSNEVKKVRLGIPPELEVSGVVPDGAAPEVAAAQAKEEARGIEPNKATSVD